MSSKTMLFDVERESSLSPNNKLLLEVWIPWASRSEDPSINSIKGHAKRLHDALKGGAGLEAIARILASNDGGRDEAIMEYSWAIPNGAALQTIANHGPILEIGSGSGYWAHLLRSDMGTDVVCVDNLHDFKGDFTTSAVPLKWINDTVIMDGALYLQQNGGCPQRTLFFCWPREFLSEAVAAYRGQTIIVVGEQSGCTSTMEDCDYADEWELEVVLEIPQWPGIHDDLRVYNKK
jgi:hypothetical protein